MNLFDLLRRRDHNLVVSEGVAMAYSVIDGESWHGLQLPPGSSVRIPDARRFSGFRSFDSHCGWMVETPRKVKLHIAIVRHGTDQELGARDFEGKFKPLYIPWPHGLTGKVDLVMSVTGPGKAPALVANHRALSRQWLYDLCRGNGLEIGPGPKPQILSGADVRVSYLEQMPPAEWNRLYNGGGKYPVRPELWENYIVGEASDLPVADGSLDFLFGSHVFEHLVNPLGHLARWRRKLAKGGKVVMVVPDLNGTKDAVQQRCSLELLIAEQQRDVWTPQVDHYVRHLRLPADNKQVVALMERKQSTHVHYYDNINAQLMLDHAVRELGYADYVIEHTPNHKDFHFVLVNG